MRIKLAWMLGLLAAANGVFMLAAPAVWYAIVRRPEHWAAQRPFHPRHRGRLSGRGRDAGVVCP